MRELDFLDPGLRKAFQETGCIVIHGMFDPKEVSEVTERMRAGFCKQRDGEGEIGPWKTAQVFKDDEAIDKLTIQRKSASGDGKVVVEIEQITGGVGR